MAIDTPVKLLTGVDLMAHLLRRAGFGATRDEVEAALAKGYEATVEELLHPEAQPDIDFDIFHRFYPDTKEAREIDVKQANWLYRMIYTFWTVQDKMAVFWHYIFATAFFKFN